MTKKEKLPWIITGVIGGIALIGALVVDVGDHDDEPGNEIDQRIAVQACEDYARPLLKAPSTAKFDLSTVGDLPDIEVSGTVDSENSFGATLRAKVRCSLTLRDDGGGVVTSLRSPVTFTPQ